MKNVLLASFIATTLSSCAMTPVLDAYSTSGGTLDTTQQATIWADNSNLSYAMITKVDGKRMPSRKGGGYPYSVAVSPGAHKIKFFVSDLSGFNPFLNGRKFADFEEQIEVEAGHAYSISFRNSPDGESVRAIVTDLGLGKACRYEVTGSMRQGYVPVALRCS